MRLAVPESRTPPGGELDACAELSSPVEPDNLTPAAAASWMQDRFDRVELSQVYELFDRDLSELVVAHLSKKQLDLADISTTEFVNLFADLVIEEFRLERMSSRDVLTLLTELHRLALRQLRYRAGRGQLLGPVARQQRVVGGIASGAFDSATATPDGRQCWRYHASTRPPSWSGVSALVAAT
ncbi:hypothetical protein [Nocardia nova]|uniref:hypothetical protein n=1 Tax=Nocardia nova TaxID=37330 RepID=UPI0007A4CC32|nr:hypothetical protein [Nocardia nova]